MQAAQREPLSGTEPIRCIIKEPSAPLCQMEVMEPPKRVILRQLLSHITNSLKPTAGRLNSFPGNSLLLTRLSPTKRNTCGGASLSRAFPVFAKILPTAYVPYCNGFTDYRTNCSAF